MAIWLEIKCDALTQKPADDVVRHGLVPSMTGTCYSERNANPSAFADTVKNAFTAAKAEARQQRWKQVRGIGWVCPVCQGRLKEASNG